MIRANNHDIMQGIKFYKIWRCMIDKDAAKRRPTNCQRCLEWGDFDNFYNWIKPLWKDKAVLCRKDPEKPWGPENCFIGDASFKMIVGRKNSRGKNKYQNIYFKNSCQRYSICLTWHGKQYFGWTKTLESAVRKRNELIIENNLPHKIIEYKGD